MSNSRSPESIARRKERQRLRYATDPEFRAKVSNYKKKWMQSERGIALRAEAYKRVKESIRDSYVIPIILRSINGKGGNLMKAEDLPRELIEAKKLAIKAVRIFQEAGRPGSKELSEEARAEYLAIHSKERAARMKEWRLANPEKVKQGRKRWVESNKEHLAAHHKEYNERYRDKISKQRKEYREINKEKISAKRKLKHLENPHQNAIYQQLMMLLRKDTV